MTIYIEPITLTEHTFLPQIWHNICGLTSANCESFGWSIITAEEPIIEPLPEVIQLDRAKLKAWLTAHGRGPMLTDWAALPVDVAEWWFLRCDYEAGSALARYLQNLLQLTDEDMVSLVAECTAGPVL